MILKITNKQLFQYRIGRSIMVSALIFWLVETAIFGFNLAAQSQLERVMDLIAWNGFLIGLAIYLLPAADLYSAIMKEAEK